MAQVCSVTPVTVTTPASITLGTTTVTPTSVTTFPTTITLQNTLTNTGSTAGSITVYMYIGNTKIPTGQTYNVPGKVGTVNGTQAVSMQYTFTAGTPAGSYSACLDTV